MLLGFKTKFEDGTPTHFKKKILSGEKKHTIRAGNRWSAGMDIHFATGVRTKQCDIFKVYPCVSVQKIEIYSMGKYFDDQRSTVITIDGVDMYEQFRFSKKGKPFFWEFISNDGFGDNAFQFFNWFKLHGINNVHFVGQIIHWTDLKYKKIILNTFNNKLPEPTKDEILALISEIKNITPKIKIAQKGNLKRLVK